MLEVINIEQGTDEWLELRNKHIRTASRTAVVMGVSPFTNKEKLAKEIKFGIKPYYNKAMQRGNELEEDIRQKIEEKMNDIFMPQVGINNGYLASLDGINFDGNTIIEIKASKQTYEEIKKGIIPDYYMAQIQHQLMVFNECKKAYLCAYDEELDDLTISEAILPEKDFKAKIDPLWDEFEVFLDKYEYKDEWVERDDLEFEMIANRYKEIDDSIKKLTLEKKELQKSLIELAGGEKTKSFGVSIYPTKRETVDYRKAIADNKIDTEKYKKLSESWTVRVENKRKL